MNPASILLLLQAINAAVAAAPKAIDLVAGSVTYIKTLCAAGAITAAQQDAMIAEVLAHKGLVDAGVVSRGWTVDADPAS